MDFAGIFPEKLNTRKHSCHMYLNINGKKFSFSFKTFSRIRKIGFSEIKITEMHLKKILSFCSYAAKDHTKNF